MTQLIWNGSASVKLLQDEFKRCCAEWVVFRLSLVYPSQPTSFLSCDNAISVHLNGNYLGGFEDMIGCMVLDVRLTSY